MYKGFYSNYPIGSLSVIVSPDFFLIAANVENFTTEGRGCINADYRPIGPYQFYAEIPLSACKYLCQYKHDAVCSMVLYLPLNRSCYLHPVREPVGNRDGCDNAVWYKRQRILGNIVFPYT